MMTHVASPLFTAVFLKVGDVWCSTDRVLDRVLMATELSCCAALDGKQLSQYYEFRLYFCSGDV